MKIDLQIQLRREIDHIFNSGANEIRVFDMAVNFIKKNFEKETKYFKLRHKPTGLYYQDSSYACNLSTKGKFYKEKPLIPTDIRIRFSPSRKSASQPILRDYYNIQHGTFPDVTFKTKSSEWEIIKID